MEPIRCMTYVGNDYVEVKVVQFVVNGEECYGVCIYRQQIIVVPVGKLTVIQFSRH